METAATESRPLTSAVAPETVEAPSATQRLAGYLPGLVAAGVVALVGFEDGGYFATTWGPVTLALLGASAVVLALHPRPNLGRRALAMPGVLALLLVWVLASSAWGSPSEAVPEAQRTVLYVAGALALALVLRRGVTAGVLIGIWAGICVVCLYALATRLFPEQFATFDPIAGYRLSEPVGYWNALGLLAAFGVLLAFGLAARGELLVVRLAAAASTVPLALTCYFTFSRGAWGALATGVVVAVILDPRRLRLGLTMVLVAPWPGLAVLIASTSGPLTESGGHTLAAAAEDGRAVAAVGAGLALFAAGAVTLAAAFESRVRVGPIVRRVGNGAVVAGVVAALAAGVLVLGGPSGIANSFAAGYPSGGEDLNERLFTLSGNGRVEQWRVALDDASEHPVLGSGAGSFERYWLEHRPEALAIEDAHTLYIEVLAEVGPIGLALILALFGFPLVLAVGARHRPLVPIAAAVLVAYLAHAAIDWDWEFPVLTLVALGCAGVIVAETVKETGEPSRPARFAVLAAVIAIVPLVGVTTLGTRAEAAAATAFDARDFDRSAKEASRAERLGPWTVEPLVLLGRAQAAGGDRAAARATFERVVAREPDHWRAWLELAAVSSGPTREAALRQARALNPLESHIEDLEQGP
jgi:O-Antigen ligase